MDFNKAYMADLRYFSFVVNGILESHIYLFVIEVNFSACVASYRYNGAYLTVLLFHVIVL